MAPVSSFLILGLHVFTALAAKPKALNIKNLVTFGDSYTDITAFSFPLWPVWASGYAKPNFKLLDFAKAGATCDQNLTPRVFPAVFQDEIPAFLNTTKNGKTLNQEQTLYTLWLGTNDVGVGELLTGQANPGVSLVNTTACAVSWVSTLYHEVGARNFFFQNMIPLEAVPLYQPNSYPDRYWTAQRNTTEWSIFMRELTVTGNALSELMLQNVAKTLPESNICVFDSHGLFTDILAHPNLYLNGTLPLNITGASTSCVFSLNESTSDTGDCTIHTGAESDSFVWFDELHPSEQSHRIVGREIVKAINGTSDRWLKCF